MEIVTINCYRNHENVKMRKHQQNNINYSQMIFNMENLKFKMMIKKMMMLIEDD